jgi:hypothetical protein
MTCSNKSKQNCHVTWLVTLCRKWSEALTFRLARRSQYDAEVKEVRSGNETICYRQAGGTDYLSAADVAKPPTLKNNNAALIIRQLFSCSLRSRQVGAIHTLYLYSAMSDMSLPTSSCGRRASAPTSQESRKLDRTT